MRLSATHAAIAKGERMRLPPKKTSRDRGPDGLLDFVPWLSPEYVSPVWLEPLTVELDVFSKAIRKAKKPGALRLCISVPPRHTKSTTVHHWVTQLLLTDPTLRILYASYDESFAAMNLRSIRRLMVNAAVGIGDIDKALHIETVEGGAVRACGIQAPPTGEGFDVVIVDDAIRKLADALSKPIRDRIAEGFFSNLLTRRRPGKVTAYLIVATRWHEDDLTGRLHQKGWRVINLPALLPNGEPLAPQLFALDELDEIRTANAYTWHALYMGDPAPRTGRMFGDPYWVDALPTEGRRVVGVDLAHTAKRRSDRHALLELLDPGDGNYYVSRFIAQRGPLTDVVSPSTGLVLEQGFVHELARTTHRAAMYTGRDEDLVLDMLSKLGGARAHVEARRAITDKRARATPASTAWNQGRIRIPRNAPWAEDFVSKVLAFSGDDDGIDEEVDCLAVAYDMLAESPSRITPAVSSTSSRRLAIGTRRRWT